MRVSFILFFLTCFFLHASELNSSPNDRSGGLFKPEFGAEASVNLASTFSESFENWPPTGWSFVTPDGGKGWQRVETGTSPLPGWSTGTVTALPGGGKYVAYATLTTSGANRNDQWLISPAVTVSAGDSLSFWITAQGTALYGDHVEVRISTTGKNVSDFTDRILDINFLAGAGYPWKKYKAGLAAYAGKSIYIAWRETTTDNRNEGAFIMLDQVRIGPPVMNDVALLDISLPKYSAPGEIPVSGTFLNFGLGVVTQLDINWQADEGPIHSTRLSGLTIGTDQTFSFLSEKAFNPVPGVHGIKVWLSGLNGEVPDENSTNDLVFKMITIGSKGVPNLPLIEEFTSSTCPPCAGFNSTVMNPFMESNRVPVIKYQMNWPLPGDKYYNGDGGVRRQFYGITGVPTLLIAGMVSAKNTGAIISSVSGYQNTQALIAIKAHHQILKLARKIEVKAVITPYFSESGFKVHIAVVEKKTTGNIGNNGETEFRSVLMKMIPGGNGTDLDLTDGVPQTLRLSADLNGTYIEDYNDLEVIVFVQQTKTKEVFQSAFSEEIEDIALTVDHMDHGNLKIFPNPTDGRVTVTYPAEFRISVYDAQGRLLQEYNQAKFTGNLDLSRFEKGIYFIKIFTNTGFTTERIMLR